MAHTAPPTEHDYQLAEAAKQRRNKNPKARATHEESAAINRILVQQALEKLNTKTQEKPQ